MNLGALREPKTSILPGKRVKEAGETQAKKRPQVRVAAFLDGTDKALEPFDVSRIKDLEKFKARAGDKAQAQAVVYRSGVSPKWKALSGALKIAAHVVIPALLGVLAGPVGVAAGLAIDGILLLDGVTLSGMNELESACYQRRELKEPNWKGRRTYRITQDRTPQIDSKVLRNKPEIKKTSSYDLRCLLYDQFTPEDPDSTDILLVGGHGLGFRQVAGMTVKDFAGALAKKPDIILMESCLEGNLETLSQLQNRAQYAVLSEEPLNADALPVTDMLMEAAGPEKDAGVIAKNMVKTAEKNQRETIKTLAAYDLSRVGETLDNLDKLGHALRGEFNRGNRKEIQAAVKEARKLGQSRLSPINSRLLGFSDLGGFLKALQQKSLEPETLKLAQTAEQSLNRMVIAKTGDKKRRDLSGVSFLSRQTLDKMSMGMDLGKYQDVPLPRGWKRFIDDLWKR